MASQADIVAMMISALAVTEPDLDTSVGSVTRDILDAFAAAVSAQSLDSQLLTYQYDIYSKIGADLDSFVQLFGLSRHPATLATGTVTFARQVATDIITLPPATQVGSADGSVTVQTITAAVLEPGQLTVTVPVQAVVAGPGGNSAAKTLTVLQTPIAEITSVSNLNPLTGGTNQEPDSQLQRRWVDTVFRNMAGTEQMFLGIALNDPDCTVANVVGSATRRTEQLQISGGQAASTVVDAKYVYPSGQVAGRNIDSGDVAAPGLQYTWDYNTIPPVVAAIDRSYFPEGQVIDLSFLYMVTASRNNADQGIFGRVDVWCQGQRAKAASQSVAFNNRFTFQSSPSSSYYNGSFVRPDGTSPVIGNIFIPLAFGPILTMPSTLVINGVTYGIADSANPLGTISGGIHYAYQIVHRSGAFGWSPYSDFGLEWQDSMQPVTNAPVVISEDYTYNDVPLAIQKSIESWRLAGIDVLAHQGLQAFLQFSLAIIYDPSISQTVTQAAIATSLSGYLSGLGFNSRVYPSSVLQVVENTPGVIASRFLTGADYRTWNPSAPNNFNVGVQQVINGVVVKSYVDSSGNPVDADFGDDTIPVFGGTILVTKSANTLGAFA